MGISREVSARANALLDIFSDEGINLTHLHLQKLMYLDYGNYLIHNKSEENAIQFQAWKYGPVIPELFEYLKHLKNKYILKPIKAENGIAYILSNLKFTKQIFRLYWNLSPEELIEITHRENGAWLKVYKPNENIHIPEEDIEKEFKYYELHGIWLKKITTRLFA